MFMAKRYALSLSAMPSPKKEHCISFPALDGGLNLYELESRLKANESPAMKNLCWKDGALSCRKGQEWLLEAPGLGVGHAAFEELFWGSAFFHIGSGIYRLDMEGESSGLQLLMDNIGQRRGTFFRYGEQLLYKNPGHFIGITYDETAAEPFTAEHVPAYTPVTYINCDPDGGGDEYQPENRLSPQKTVWYSAKELESFISFTGDGSKSAFSLEDTAAETLGRVLYVKLEGLTLSSSAYSADLASGTVNFTSPPAEGAAIEVCFTRNAALYRLPGGDIDSVDSVEVEGEVLTEGEDYTVDLEKGTVLFTTAPSYPRPFFPNTVRISYSKANAAAYNAVMDCPYAAVYGGDRKLCIVLGGCTAQPNAYFWNGSHAAMDPGYWPMEQYNLAGDGSERIVGFGRQQDLLLIFKEHSVGRAGFSLTTVSTDRALIEMPYTAINSRIGCDLPWSIQLIENNLVFCNSRQGAHMVLDSSSAYENNIVQLSKKVNGSGKKPGLLRDIEDAGKENVCSFDDDECYWLCANGNVYAWNYKLSSFREPSWFYYTNMSPSAFFRDGEGGLYHMNAQGALTALRDIFSDYDEGIEKLFRFADQNMGSYDALKDIRSVIFVIRSDTDSFTRVRYETDYESRLDLTPLRSFTWRLYPRNLAYRNLSVQRFAHVERRCPGCRHVRHFTMQLENGEAGQDLSLLSAQLQYTFQGRDR